MLERKLTSLQFLVLVRDVLEKEKTLRLCARGNSMRPFINDSDRLEITSVTGQSIYLGDIVVFSFAKDDSRNGKEPGQLLVHRVVRIRQAAQERQFLLHGDAMLHPDGWVVEANILGKVIAIQRSRASSSNCSWRYLNTFTTRLISLSIVIFLSAMKSVYRLLHKPAS
jgi:signal peptidase I